MTKSGNRRVRWMIMELAWGWLRFQPDSALSAWFRERCGDGGQRLRHIGIVAVARKLLPQDRSLARGSGTQSGVGA